MIDKVFTRNQLESGSFTRDIGYLVQNGYHQKHGGDVVYVFQPSTLSIWYERGGTSHGGGFTYDTHVPLIFYGNGIKKGILTKNLKLPILHQHFRLYWV